MKKTFRIRRMVIVLVLVLAAVGICVAASRFGGTSAGGSGHGVGGVPVVGLAAE